MARPYHPAAPFLAPTTGSLDQKLALISAELNKKADQGVQGTAFPFLALIDPSGQVWRVLVDNTGALSTELVPR